MQGRMRLVLAQAMQIERRVDRHMAAGELLPGAALERRKARHPRTRRGL